MWQIYCGFWPIAAGSNLTIQGQPGHRLLWRTSLDRQTETRLRHGHTINVSRDDKTWWRYQFVSVQRVTENLQDVWLEPLDQDKARLKDRLSLGTMVGN